MAHPRKQRHVDEDERSWSDSDNSENGNEEMEIINVDFDVKTPEYSDKLGIKNLLQQLFLKSRVNTHQLADLLIEQSDITGVIKEADSDGMEVDDDMEVNFGVFSVVNLTEKRNLECIKQIHHYLLDNCKECASHRKLVNILGDTTKHVGLIISERFINIPAKIAVPLYSGLRNDMRKAKAAFDFAYYLFISKLTVFNSGSHTENIVFLNPEEELIAEEAEVSFEFPVEDEHDSGLSGRWRDDDNEGLPKRRVLLLPESKWDIMFNKLVAELGSDLQT